MKCERCGRARESQVVPGTLGRLQTWHYEPGPADTILKRPGWLCDRCWWAARVEGPAEAPSSG